MIHQRKHNRCASTERIFSMSSTTSEVVIVNYFILIFLSDVEIGRRIKSKF